MPSNSKPRQSRLRDSCDGCSQAKVKCSKTRPICSRCLVCGLECFFSLSNRAGSPESAQSAYFPANTVRMHVPDIPPIMNEESLMFGQHFSAGIYITEPVWHTPSTTTTKDTMSINYPVYSELAIPGVNHTNARHQAPTADICGDATFCTSSISCSAGSDPDRMITTSQMQPQRGYSQSSNVAIATNMIPWEYPMQQGTTPFTAIPPVIHMTAATYDTGPFNTPYVQPAVEHEQPSTRGGSLCTCVSVCLQSLEALHNASSPQVPPLDLVLSLNQKAVIGCAAILFCSRCMSQPDTHTAAMLVATVFGEIIRSYQNASTIYFENETATMATQISSEGHLGVSLGAYKLGDEDGKWLEMEILNLEFQKLQAIYRHFRNIYTDLSNDPQISKTMIDYLDHKLSIALEVINCQRRSMRPLNYAKRTSALPRFSQSLKFSGIVTKEA
ncbi:Putative zn(2)Cys(6) fungal-type DNA-binding domain-containing protein [Colletotrichum destructivum]|uniref:Zn(2)Cys(6) fungal-type DNA-binding domain-containing protein n=1 Tax=Colletotrichum destructivum TaxID=34406 RepID=A0AAX4J4X6_9PEZI|nr:Putative zn(2)Cys(6) fungal-type DNA-binding domain-containing protein [Colletotrichum destructivum]